MSSRPPVAVRWAMRALAPVIAAVATVGVGLVATHQQAAHPASGSATPDAIPAGAGPPLPAEPGPVPTSLPTASRPAVPAPRRPAASAPATAPQRPASTQAPAARPLPSLLGDVVFTSDRIHPAPSQPSSDPVTISAHGFDLWAMHPDGSGQRPLTVTAADQNPTLSPDGAHVAWIVGNSPTSYDVWVMASDGTDRRKLTPAPGVYMHPSWSPDGTRIAFASDDGRQCDVVLVDPDGGRLETRPTPDVDEYQMSWSPDSTQLVFSGTYGHGLGIMDVASGRERMLPPAKAFGPDWSPDGALLLFSDGRQLFTVAPDGTGLRQLTRGPGQRLDGTWTRDGSAIVVSHASPSPPYATQLVLIHSDGTGWLPLTTGPGSSSDPAT